MNQKMIVSKFGGTSMGDAACMRRSAEVSLKQGSNVIVVSATSGTTNLLIELAASAQKKSAWDQTEIILKKITESHLKIARDLGISTVSNTAVELNLLFIELESLAKGIHLLKDCSAKAFDYLQSFGERMSSLLFTDAMMQASRKEKATKDVRFLDSRTILKTDDQFGRARPLTELVINRATDILMPLLRSGVIFVTQGFIGETLEGNTTTLGRGGSDYSAAIIAEAVSADILEIWTDVPGIATTDPRLCADAKSLKEISFKEASELATF
ncbi:MAG: aspartate kinase, partial [Bdellovibrio sp.]|nr:aspartate kinase [Bdellovibrio sp.]